MLSSPETFGCSGAELDSGCTYRYRSQNLDRICRCRHGLLRGDEQRQVDGGDRDQENPGQAGADERSEARHPKQHALESVGPVPIGVTSF